MKKITELTGEEVLCLAISVEARNQKVYEEYGKLFETYEPSAGKVFQEMAREEHRHEQLLRAFYQRKFGRAPQEEPFEEVIEPVEAPMLPDGEVFVYDGMTPERAFGIAKRTEQLAKEFYENLAVKAADSELKILYKELANIEGDHLEAASHLEKTYLDEETRRTEP